MKVTIAHFWGGEFTTCAELGFRRRKSLLNAAGVAVRYSQIMNKSYRALYLPIGEVEVRLQNYMFYKNGLVRVIGV